MSTKSNPNGMFFGNSSKKENGDTEDNRKYEELADRVAEKKARYFSQQDEES